MFRLIGHLPEQIPLIQEVLLVREQHQPAELHLEVNRPLQNQHQVIQEHIPDQLAVQVLIQHILVLLQPIIVRLEQIEVQPIPDHQIQILLQPDLHLLIELQVQPVVQIQILDLQRPKEAIQHNHVLHLHHRGAVVIQVRVHRVLQVQEQLEVQVLPQVIDQVLVPAVRAEGDR